MVSSQDLGWNELFNPGQAASGDSILPFLGLAQALAARSQVVADVGCGRGSEADGRSTHATPIIQDLRGPGRRVIGLDVDPTGGQNPLIDEFRPIREDGTWPLDDACVDLAVSDWVLEHVQQPAAFVAELARVVRPGGAFLARTPSRHSPLSLGARLVPNRDHATVLSVLQPRRQSRDVFPTAYLMNTEATIVSLMQDAFDVVVLHRSDLTQYFLRWPRAARVIAAAEPHLPKAFRSTLVVYARRRRPTAPSSPSGH